MNHTFPTINKRFPTILKGCHTQPLIRGITKVADKTITDIGVDLEETFSINFSTI